MNHIAIGAQTNQNVHIHSYMASSGEKIEIYETYDLMNVMFIEAFPYMDDGHLRNSSIAKGNDLEQLISDVEEFLNREAIRVKERNANVDPVRVAFVKGRDNARSNIDFNKEWVSGVSEEEQEAYRYAFNKYSK
ncbi:hypothetical protein OH460_09075 [Vibrio sp. Makdt]|uniref:hypothetical protein n=1 Tax=Vibrio sp. Makdt TaxID=2998828 RepID=UPI0022CDAA78|nr:hypothetical protein [Vibrio sp. Makdt]MDA0152454.1 hypothetical protein [Vibrio sp. Makdt]